MQPDLGTVTSLVAEQVRATSRSPALVAVDGPSGSGKSTVARPIPEALGATLVPIDDFVTWNDFGAFWPRFEQQVLRPLLAGEEAAARHADAMQLETWSRAVVV